MVVNSCISSALLVAALTINGISDTPSQRRARSKVPLGARQAAVKTREALQRWDYSAGEEEPKPEADGNTDSGLARRLLLRTGGQDDEDSDAPETEDGDGSGDEEDESDGDKAVLLDATTQCFAAARQRLFAGRIEVQADLRAAILAAFAELRALVPLDAWQSLVVGRFGAIITIS